MTVAVNRARPSPRPLLAGRRTTPAKVLWLCRVDELEPAGDVRRLVRRYERKASHLEPSPGWPARSSATAD
jgi:hypothetical protein